MIASIVPMALKLKMSDEIAAQTAEFLARGKRVTEVEPGITHNDGETYREFQSKVAKMNAAAKDAG
jgi:hypothetical protein